MKTNQIMKRDFYNSKISQRTKDGFFNATELLAVYNSTSTTTKRFADFWENNTTKNFIKELENELILNVPNSPHLTYQTTRGRGGATWMHPYLFVKFAMWLSPKFELQIIKWVYDNLLEYRNSAGDYYKDMTNEVKEYHLRNANGKFNPRVYIIEANLMNALCGIDRGQRNELSEKQLALLNEYQLENIELLSQNLSYEERKKILVNFIRKAKNKLERRFKK